MAEPYLEKIASPLGLPDEPTTLVRANAAVMVAAGTTFGLGWFPRLSATALVASLMPTTLVGHAFWREKDPATRKAQLTQFLKNAAVVGGLLLAAVDTEGKPGLAWRTDRAVKDAKRSLQRGAKDTKQAAKAATREAKLAATQAQAKLT